MMLNIRKREICIHGILPERCSSCQIQTLILCLEERYIFIQKDLYKLIFEEVCQYFARKEFIEHGLDFGITKDGELIRSGPDIKIVFIGRKDSWEMFLFLLQKIQDNYRFDGKKIPEVLSITKPLPWLFPKYKDYMIYCIDLT